MNYKFVLVLCLHVSSIYSAPMKVQVLPLPYGIQPQNPLMSLQNPFLRQAVAGFQSPLMYQQQPMMLLLPNAAPPTEADDRYINLNEEDSTSNLKSNTGHVDESKDAVILDAEPNPSELDLKKAVVVMPNDARFSIGTIISWIPFLPIEINVPDTINWISGLLPGNWFSRPATQKPEGMKRVSNKGPMPILVVPGPMMPQYK